MREPKGTATKEVRNEIVSSLAHGSALDIAGHGEANHAAMAEAIARVSYVASLDTFGSAVNMTGR